MIASMKSWSDRLLLMWLWLWLLVEMAVAVGNAVVDATLPWSSLVLVVSLTFSSSL